MIETVVAFEGTIYEDGYGMIAQKVMRDREIPAMSKAIYSYLCAFAGSTKKGSTGDRSAFPGVKLMMAELGIKTDDTFYKYRKPLIDRGYIKVRQERGKGKFAKNIYSIVAVPKPEEPAPVKDSAPTPKLSGTAPHPISSGTAESSSMNTGTNSNSFKSISSLKREVEEEAPLARLLAFYKNNISEDALDLAAAKLSIWITKLPIEVVAAELENCAASGAKTWKYIETALIDDFAKNIDTVEALQKKIADHAASRQPGRKKSAGTRQPIRKEQNPEWFAAHQALKAQNESAEESSISEDEFEKMRRELEDDLKKYK